MPEEKSKEGKKKEGTSKKDKVLVSGSTKYNRLKQKVEVDGKEKTIVLWVAEGHTVNSTNYVFQESKDKSTGNTMYFKPASPNEVLFELPDIGGGDPPTDSTQHEKKRHKERKEWKDDTAKKNLLSAVKKCTNDYIRAGHINKEEASTIGSQVSKEYMSAFKKLDTEGELWISEAVAKQVQEKPTEATQQKSEQEFIPSLPLSQNRCTPPSSLLVSRAWYLKDPFYPSRLSVPNTRRGLAEGILEDTTFLQPGGGAIKVLCAVPAMLGQDASQSMILSVVRDWAGAFCFMHIEPANDLNEAAVCGAWPILEHVDFPESGFVRIGLKVDDNTFVATFQNQDSANFLHESLKLAMSSMYGSGNDENRIVKMRALSVEFAAHEPNYFPGGNFPDGSITVRKILTGMGDQSDWCTLRVAMRTPESRDEIIRSWIRLVDEGIPLRQRDLLHVFLQLIEESARVIAYHEDATLSRSIVSHLTALQSDQSESTKNRIERLKTCVRIVEPIMESWTSRQEEPDRVFERCFEPIDGSPAAYEMKSKIAERKANYSATHDPPGIYLSMLCYCGDMIFCNSTGSLFSELIVSQPTDSEIAELSPDSTDFQWILSLGGANENWVSETSNWAEIYDNVGRQTFRGKFLHAASRLLHSQPFSTVGCIFDVPVHLDKVGCLHIVTVFEASSRDQVPVSAGMWRKAVEFESQLYLQSMMASHSSRIRFLPSGYNNCIRFVKGAIDYHHSLQKRLSTGFYIGYLLIRPTSNGFQIAVPETNRMLPPMSMVSQEIPTLEQWRWVQGLNERRTRTGSFGLSFVDGHDTDVRVFEQNFARAVIELEQACGHSVTKLYDLELFPIDEAQTCRALFAVELIDTASLDGAVPMVFKNMDIVEEQYFRMYWPRLYSSIEDERRSHYRRSFATAQPFSVDDCFRLTYESSLFFFSSIDKLFFLLSWIRPIVSWAVTDGRHLAHLHGGTSDESTARSVEEAVEVAVSNYAAAQDINVQTMRSLLLESSLSPHFSWPALLAKLRELDRVLHSGYSQRRGAKKTVENRPRKVRTHDELLSDEDVDDDVPRQPTDYHLPCSIEELIFSNSHEEDAEKYFSMQEIIHEVVEVASVDCVDVGTTKEIGSIITDMISVIEATNDLVDDAALLSLKQGAEAEAMKERTKFQQTWLKAFERKDPNPSPLPDQSIESFEHALFYDGSPASITGFDQGLRVCIAKAASTQHQLQTLCRISNSVSEALELNQSVQEYGQLLSHRESLVPSAQSHSQPVAPPSGSTTSYSAVGEGSNVSSQAPLVIVSKDFREFPIDNVDPRRCLVLHGLSGKTRFPTISWEFMDILRTHLSCTDFSLPSQLSRVQCLPNDGEVFVEMALQLKCPLLLLHFATVVFGSHSGTVSFFTNEAALQLKSLFSNSFLFEYSVKDWFYIESLGGDAVAPGFDVLWWMRFFQESSEQKEANSDSYTDHEGCWKQVYCESRVRVFLTFGIAALSREEVSLWAQNAGKFVEYLNLRDTSVGDAETEVLASCCPNLKSLDLSYTSVSGKCVEMLIQGCKCLAECSITGCDVTPSEHDALARHCTENRNKISA